MATTHVIKIVRRGTGAAPEGDRRTKVRRGDVVTFTTAPNARGVTLAFAGGRSPFLGQSVVYNTPLRILAAFDASSVDANTFPYACTIEVDGQQFTTADSGGEMEIIQS